MSDRDRFRVWDRTMKRYGGFNFFLSEDGVLFEEDEGRLQVMDPVRFQVERCTGKKDIDGQLVFQGDKLECPDKDRPALTVEWHEFRWCLSDGVYSHRPPLRTAVNQRVVGTIHDEEG